MKWMGVIAGPAGRGARLSTGKALRWYPEFSLRRWPHFMTSSPLLPSAREIAARIRRKDVSPVEVARCHLDCIERLNPKLNAFVDYRPEAVLAQARDAEKAILRGDDV